MISLHERQIVRRTYIDGDEIDFGVTVLASLGGGHVNDLARAT
jgi:hypothetical protein